MINSAGRKQMSRIALSLKRAGPAARMNADDRPPSARRPPHPVLRLIAITAQAVILLFFGLALAFAILNIPVSG